MEVERKEWTLEEYVHGGVPTSRHLKLRTSSMVVSKDDVPDGHVLLRLHWLSVDPYLRSRMGSQRDGLYFPPFELHKPVTTFGIGEVLETKHSSFGVGEMVLNTVAPVTEYCTVPAHALRKIELEPDSGVSALDYLSALGIPGFAAWIGITVIGDPKPGENVFISAAAGGVGIVAGQLAKLKGCRVVGSVGSDAKVKLLKEEIGYDDVFNYNVETDYDAALSKYFPDGIDIYLDNVGGRMLEAVLNHLNTRARIPLCGMISQYNQVWTERFGVRNLLNMVGKEARMEGFMLDWNRFGEFAEEMAGYIKQRKIVTKHEIYRGTESFLESIQSLFASSNAGKVIIQASEDAKA
ncbi:(+)-pulegone reductase-like [Rhodamnia argentea]|uniref:(+)-pulegone reductase-like n=1 Tax=Rhodamnia argentea TaxID=178133 RepID=A0A8B8PFI2_9MYRT|nr:(+)-pulegone reductase-like [Rhodamnia argentea]